MKCPGCHGSMRARPLTRFAAESPVLLVHVNLFGGGYVQQVEAVLKHFA